MEKSLFENVGGSYYNVNGYLADIDKQAIDRLERIVKKMKQAEGITEQLKEADPMFWVQRMNNIRACAMELINEEIIYA